MFFFYTGTMKPVWNSIKTREGFPLRFPQKMQLKDGLVAEFDEFMQMFTVRDSRNLELGSDMLRREKDAIKCVDIEVTPFAREKGIGGLMHALSVMLMKENKAKNIYLDSLAQAVRFHFNKGFNTANINETNAAICMKRIMSSQTPFDDLKTRASKLLYDLSLGGKEAIEKANKLYDEFIIRVVRNNIPVQDANYPHTLCMGLKMKDAHKNGELYNSILQDFGIDYTI